MNFAEYSDVLSREFNERLVSRSKPLAIAEALAERSFSVLGLPSRIRVVEKCIVVTRSKTVIDGQKTRKIRDAWPFGNAYPDLLREFRSDVENGVVVGTDLLTNSPARSDFDAGSGEAVLRVLETDRYPNVRWPSDFSLSPHQQAAINELFVRLSKSGTFSINGPPGTGKTTLLMDVVAEIIARALRVLAQFADPLSVFTPTADRETADVRAERLD